MTTQQQTRLDELATDYQSISPRPAYDGTDSVMVDCYDRSLPERCSMCGEEESAHLSHQFRVVVPKATFRVAPSGFVQNLEETDFEELIA